MYIIYNYTENTKDVIVIIIEYIRDEINTKPIRNLLCLMDNSPYSPDSYIVTSFNDIPSVKAKLSWSICKATNPTKSLENESIKGIFIQHTHILAA